MWVAVSRALRQWMEVSAFVLAGRRVDEQRGAQGNASVAKATATWKKWSAAWRGIESGITKFCAEVDLTCDQLLVLANGSSPLVEAARDLLYGDARVDRQWEDVTLRMLRQAWQVGTSRGSRIQ
jgi:hypothetical protein